jgi:hypothetical protein
VLGEHVTHSIQKIKELAEETTDPTLKLAVQSLGDAISVGNVNNSTGVAIGRNIRMVVNQLNLPVETVAAILDVRSAVAASMGLDPDRYRLGTLLADKTSGFVGRDYVFQAIDEFLRNQVNGYFVIEGDPGLGKSAILAEYVRRTGCIAHFNVRAAGINSAKQFLENVCTQLIIDFGLPYLTLPPSTGHDSAFLSKFLEEASGKLASGEHLVIAVDALDEVDMSGHPDGANILFLPETLPDHVYFILTRRTIELPFVVQAPQTKLDLMSHPAENRKDVEFYLHRSSGRAAILGWMAKQNMPEETFVTKLADLSENNFMYLRYVLPEIEIGGFQNLDIQRLPAGLQGYYDDHWRGMGMTAKPLPRVKIRVIYIMCEVRQPVSRELIAQFATDQVMKVDELAVQEVLEEWKQFLHEQRTPERLLYSLYHASFRDFLHRKEIVHAAGVTIKDVNGLIANNLWESVFGAG